MSDLEFDKVDDVTPAQERVFMNKLTKALANDDGSAAEGHLKAGRPICYVDPSVKDGMVQEYSDGYREVVWLEDDDTLTVLRQL